MPIIKNLSASEKKSHDWNTLLSDKQKKDVEKILSIIDKNRLPKFGRAGNQRYSPADSDKKIYKGIYNGREADDGIYKLITDGKLELGNRYSTGKEIVQNYTITDWSYVVQTTKILDENGKAAIHANIETADVKMKYYIQSRLSMGLS